MASFGEQMRRERELRGVTLPELSNATKIGLRYLQALEDDRFELLPGGIYNRGFVRAVARYLKLDEHHWVNGYARAANEPPEVLAHFVPGPPRPSASRLHPRWSLLFLLVLFGVAAYLVHDLRQQQAAEAAPTRSMVAAQPPPHSNQASAVASPMSARSAPSSNRTEAKAARVADSLHLQIDVVENAWVRVTADGRPHFEGIMKAGDSRSLDATGQIELVTGNASAVVLTLNSETLPPLGSPGERKRVVLTPKDLKPQSN